MPVPVPAHAPVPEVEASASGAGASEPPIPPPAPVPATAVISQLPPLSAPCPSDAELRQLVDQRLQAAEATLAASALAPVQHAAGNPLLSAETARLLDLRQFVQIVSGLAASSWTTFRLLLAIHRLDLLLGWQLPTAPVELVPGTDVNSIPPLQFNSLEQWRAGLPILDAATASQLRRNATASLLHMGSHDTALPPPDANDPADMIRTAPPAIRPRKASELPPFLGKEAPGERPVVDAQAILQLALETSCQQCSAGEACYHPALALECDQHSLQWKEVPTKPNLETPVYQFDETTWTAIQGHVDKAAATGAIECLSDALDVPPLTSDAFTVSNVFLVRVFDLKLSDEQSAALRSATSMAAVAALAMHLTTLFMLAYAGPAQALMAMHASNAAALAQALAALWDATMTSLHTEKKSRLVINLRSHVNRRLHLWPFRYAAFATFLGHVKSGGWLAKTDVSAGFHHIRIKPGDRKFLVFKTLKGWYRFTRLPFGLSTAPALFSWLTAEVNALLRINGVSASLVYIDDFIVYADSQTACADALALLKDICRRLNIKLDPDKTEGPTQRITILGYTIDTTAMMVSIPPEKILKTIFYATTFKACAAAGIPVPAGPIRKAAGSFVRLATVNPDLRPHLRGFSLAGDGHRWSSPSTSVVAVHKHPTLLANVTWISRAAQDGELDGEHLIPAPSLRPWNTLYVTSDASLSGPAGHRSAGAGVRCGPALLSLMLPASYGSFSIASLELLPLAVFILLASDLLAGALLVIGIDNQGDAYSINSGRARSPEAALLINLIYLLRKFSGCDILATWISRVFNFLADRLAACRSEPEVRNLSSFASAVPPAQLDWGRLSSIVTSANDDPKWEPDDATTGGLDTA